MSKPQPGSCDADPRGDHQAGSEAADALRHLLDVTARQTCNLDHYMTVLGVVKALESGHMLLVTRASAEAALNDARVWGQWYESHGANSSQAKSLQSSARALLGLRAK